MELRAEVGLTENGFPAAGLSRTFSQPWGSAVLIYISGQATCQSTKLISQLIQARDKI